MSRKEDLLAAGLLKVSVRMLLPSKNGEDHVIAATALVTEQEWRNLQDTIYANLAAGFKGKYFVIPKGVAIVSLRLDTPANIKV